MNFNYNVELPFIKCDKNVLISKCKENNIPLEIAIDCIIYKDNDILVLDTNHPFYPDNHKYEEFIDQNQSDIPIPMINSETKPNGGPGTELKKLLKKIGITASPTCSCNARARVMDEKGIEWCENNIDTIIAWLREEAAKRHLPFMDIAGKIIIKKAISNAKKLLT